MSDAFDLKGLDRALETLKALPNNIRKKVVVGAARKAMRVVTKAARINALKHDDPGTGRKIAQNIQQRFGSRTYKATGDVVYRVGVATPPGRIPKGNPDEGSKGATPHWHLIELGTENIAADPFLLPALTENIETVIGVFATEVNAGLDKL